MARMDSEDERLLQKEALKQQLDLFPLEFPSDRYSCIVVDPPWPYHMRENDPTHRNRCPYPSMSMPQILALPVSELADRQAYLWLWFTKDYGEQAYECLRVWGFQPKQILPWIKTTNDGTRVRIGVGHWLRNAAEFCLLGVRGNPPCFSHLGHCSQSNVIMAPPREHSRKPEKFYDLVDTLLPTSKKLEMFARQKRPNWDVWGAETNLFEGEGESNANNEQENSSTTAVDGHINTEAGNISDNGAGES